MSPRVLLIPCSCLAVAVAMGICTLSVQAERILYLDAAAPGLMPDTFWVDLSESQHDFMATGVESSRPIHVDNPGSSDDYYDFELDNGFVGVGDESLFDFETDVAGAGMGTPFSIHAYFKRTGFLGGGNTGEFLVMKTNVEGGGQFNGWLFGGNGDNPSRVDMFMQVGNNTERLSSQRVQRPQCDAHSDSRRERDPRGYQAVCQRGSAGHDLDCGRSRD